MSKGSECGSCVDLGQQTKEVGHCHRCVTFHRCSGSVSCGMGRAWSSGAVARDVGVFWLHPGAEMQTPRTGSGAGVFCEGSCPFFLCFCSSSHLWRQLGPCSPRKLLNYKHLTPTTLSSLPGRSESDCDPCPYLVLVLCPSCFPRQPWIPEGSL